MDQFRIVSQAMRIEHRHGDQWVQLEAAPAHDVAQHDPEVAWEHGRIYRCPSCAEEIRVVDDAELRR